MIWRWIKLKYGSPALHPNKYPHLGGELEAARTPRNKSHSKLEILCWTSSGIVANTMEAVLVRMVRVQMEITLFSMISYNNATSNTWVQIMYRRRVPLPFYRGYPVTFVHPNCVQFDCAVPHSQIEIYFAIVSMFHSKPMIHFDLDSTPAVAGGIG